jgi:hypothetical protein
MKLTTVIGAVAALLVAAVPTATAQTAADTAGIRQAALDYIEGWYSGNADRMARALHPELAKRIMNADSAGNVWIRQQGATELVQGTRFGFGTRTPADQRRTDYRLLDIFQNAASARVDAGGWIDYLHLVKWRDRWVILNVLWELRAGESRR